MKVVFLRIGEPDWRFPGYDPGYWSIYLEDIYHGVLTGPVFEKLMERTNTNTATCSMEVTRSGSFVPHMSFPDFWGAIVSPEIQNRLTQVPCTFVPVIWSKILDIKFPKPRDPSPGHVSRSVMLEMPHREDLRQNLEGYREWFVPQLRILVNFGELSRDELQKLKNDYELFRRAILDRWLTPELLDRYPAIKSPGGFIIRGDVYDQISELINSKVLGAVTYEL